MKYLTSVLGFFFAEREVRTNLGGLFRYLALLAGLIVGYAVLFHVIMEQVEGQSHSWITGDHKVLVRAGLPDAASVVLTTNDDAMNIHLAVYCRRLKPDLRIVSRITHDRNLSAIHRAGADFVLSYATLGAGTIFALLQGRGLVLIGEGIDLFTCTVPPQLEGRALRDSAIGSATGLCVIGLQDADRLIAELHSDTILVPGGELIMIGSLEQYRAFTEAYGPTSAPP